MGAARAVPAVSAGACARPAGPETLTEEHLLPEGKARTLMTPANERTGKRRRTGKVRTCIS